MNRQTLALVLLLHGMAVPAMADDGKFQFTREVRTGELHQEELLSVTLDSEVYAVARDDFADLRLIDGPGQTVPYLLQKARTTSSHTVRKTWIASDYSAQPLEGGGLEIVVQLDSDDPQPNGLTLVSPLKNFEQRVRISTSPDGRQWEPIEEEFTIFDYSRYMDVRNISVSFPETPRRYFRIVIDDVTVEQESELLELTRTMSGAKETERLEEVTIDRRPFRIERIEFWREMLAEQVSGDERVNYPVLEFEVEQDTEHQQTIIHIETQRQPITAFKLVTPEKNFSRPATVAVLRHQGTRDIWNTIGDGTVSRIDFKTLQREDLVLEFPESRAAQYRLLIDNRDNVPLRIEGIEAYGNVYELLYVAEPASTYQLVYGDPEAKPPRYDTAAIEALLDAGFQISPAELGPPLESAAFDEPARFQWKLVLNNPLILGGVILMLVILLGGGLYSAARRIDSRPGD